jgi:large subunit ribosomal protein L21
LTEILVESIIASGAKKEVVAKVEKPKTPAVKEEKGKVASKPKADIPPAKEKSAPAKKAPAKAVKADDLKKIEGIGPKAAEALANAGLESFAKLAKANPEKIKVILTEASSRMAHLEPTTWPQQAQLAAEGKWDELKKLQDKLNGGK